jgi:hypothetical protein
VHFAVGVDAALWYSSIVPLSGSVYTENGTALSILWKTSLLPDNSQMAMNTIVETAVALEIPVQVTITISFSDEMGNVIDTTTIQGSGSSAAVWGSPTKWGAFVWGSISGFFSQYPVYWHKPLVFKQGTFQITAQSYAGLTLGNLYLRYQILGYLLGPYTAGSFPTPPPVIGAGVWDTSVWDGAKWG